jgi:hypothetical protein
MNFSFDCAGNASKQEFFSLRMEIWDAQLDDPEQSQENENQACNPGDDVEGARVPVRAHQILAITEPYHEDQDDGKKNAVDDLGKLNHGDLHVFF